MTLEELKRLADIVCPGPKWAIGHTCVYYHQSGVFEGEDIVFNPSLTGEDWQQAQALRVIVAAFKLGHGQRMDHGHMGLQEYFVMWVFENDVTKFRTTECSDILSASMHALLQEGR